MHCCLCSSGRHTRDSLPDNATVALKLNISSISNQCFLLAIKNNCMSVSATSIALSSEGSQSICLKKYIYIDNISHCIPTHAKHSAPTERIGIMVRVRELDVTINRQWQLNINIFK